MINKKNLGNSRDLDLGSKSTVDSSHLDQFGYIWNHQGSLDDTNPNNPWKIKWDLTNGPLSKVLEILDTQV